MHVYNTSLFSKLTFVNYLYFKQCHTVEILCDVSIIETFLTGIPSMVEVTYFITQHTVMTLSYIFCF